MTLAAKMGFIEENLQVLAFIGAVCFGGLAGAVFTQLISWYRRPKLEIVFTEDDRGCAVDTPAELRDRNDNVVARGQQRYLRIRIENKGRSAAQGVNLCTNQITFHPLEGSADIFDEEVLDLPLALSDKVTFDLPRGGHRYIDLFCAEDFGAGIQYRFAFIVRPSRLYLRPYGAGEYSIRVFASASNSASIRKRVSWKWDGSLLGLHIAPVNLRSHPHARIDASPAQFRTVSTTDTFRLSS